MIPVASTMIGSRWLIRFPTFPATLEPNRFSTRSATGVLMWPERFGVAEVVRIKAGLGPYMASGRLQQSPQPRAGGIFRRDWWQQWTDGKFPPCSFVIGSVDGASPEKEENDPSAMTVWGVLGRTRPNFLPRALS